MFEVSSLLFGESSKVSGRISQGANKPGGESSRGRNGKGAKKPDTENVIRIQENRELLTANRMN